MAGHIEEVLQNLRPSQVTWNEALKRSVVHYLLTSREFFLQHRSHFSPDSLPERVHEQMLRVANAYFDAYEKLPSVHAMIEKMREVYQRWPDDWVATEVEIYSIYEFVACETDMAYIEELIVSYCKREAVKKALKESYELVHSNEVDKFQRIEQLIKGATSISIVHEEVSNYAAEVRQRFSDEHSDKKTKTFGIGFSKIDSELEGGLMYGEIGLFMGDSGTGKSQMLTHVAAHLVSQGHKVLFISVENSKPVVERRFDARFSFIPMKEIKNNKGVVVSKVMNAFSQQENLRIRCFPLGTASIADMEVEIERYCTRTGWYPDVIVLDYLDEVKRYANISTYESQGLIIGDFRAWCMKMKVAGFTATQTNRNAATTNIVTRSETGDSYWKIRRSDAIWTLNFDKEEGLRNIMRLWVDKHRNGRSSYMVHMKRDFTRCMFQQIEESEFQRIASAPPPIAA